MRLSVRASVRASTLSNMNISETSWPITIKFHLEHHWDGDWLHKVLGQIGSELWFPWQQIAPTGLLWVKPCGHSSSFIFDLIFFILADNENNHSILNGFEIRQDPTRDL